MALTFGNKAVSKAYFGEKDVSAIYLGTKKVFPTEEELHGTGDIRLRIKTTSANQSFPLFYRITTKSGGYVSVDWGDGNSETFTGKTTYSPEHTYATAGEYVVKLTGSKFTAVKGISSSIYNGFKDAVREILSLKMPTDSTSVALKNTFYYCVNLTGNIPAWDDCITSANETYEGCTGLTGSIPAWGANITSAYGAYNGCRGLTGNIPEWGGNITNASYTYNGCRGLTGNIPEWGGNITNAGVTYQGCTGLTGSIPAWGTKITNAQNTYNGCYGLTGNIPAWGANITIVTNTYYNCSSLTGCSAELLQDPMPSRITHHDSCVTGCVDAIRQHFTPDWGGTKEEEEAPATGDIRLRIETTSANQSFPLFYRITTEEGGYVSVDWGDGNTETLTGSTTYQPEHTYATAGEYTVKLAGSKITSVEGIRNINYNNFQNAVREILSLKMPTDSTRVSLQSAFYWCSNLTGNIPEWDDCIVDAEYTYGSCTGLTGSIPAWGVNIWTAMFTYQDCTGLTGRIPKWGANIKDASYTYYGCIGLTGCSEELLQDPMPSRITSHGNCVFGCADAVRQHFTEDWGGTKKPAEGDIRLRIETTKANQSFRLFYTIRTESGGFVSVDWGDGNVETFSDSTGYSPKHIYHRAGEYVVKLTGSKFTSVRGPNNASYEDFQNAVREILSLKMPTDSTSVSLYKAFYWCSNLTGSIPAWDDCIVDASKTYWYCSSLTGNIPEWGPNITNAYATYNGCRGLTGNIPEWGPKITDAYDTYRGCTSLTGNIPEWGANITGAGGTYQVCTGLTGNIPAWGANITHAGNTYDGCTGLTGSIPAWGPKITIAYRTYYNCKGLTGCSEELLQDPMPSRITVDEGCVEGCVDAIRQHFKQSWGGTKPG